MDFKYHAYQAHNIQLRPPKGESRSATGLTVLRSEADCSLRTSPTLSVPYVEDTADIDAPFCLDRWEHDISASEAHELGNSPYPELPDTIASADRPEEHGWDLSAQFASPISHSGEYLEPGSVMSIAEEGFRLWEQPQTSSEGNREDLEDMVMKDSTSIHDNEKDYPVENVLEKRGNMFYLQWKDGTRSWQHRNDVSDDLIDPFEDQ
ncbi:hypothetical protein C7999DRAFT_36694 [Corynascus novoguineensis]|uniref:Uncharacterized protein n=1 Tax=Corynascus novoguineensis TaxID=1126955 RepID=A0AAN7CIZ5_9PEZI|nr:hypothetical protein C7999DRAFT_36694 [Corynascus novoguineensis]